MQKHITNAGKFGIPVVVCINQFTSDSLNEIECVRKCALDAGAVDAVVSNHWYVIAILMIC
jgi:methylenetetrahydrofolate dehydrogenase (NADP+)/methenyltetrahydrofolate cyclohydrolase/formyltetrahydrofolate synthetase